MKSTERKGSRFCLDCRKGVMRIFLLITSLMNLALFTYLLIDHLRKDKDKKEKTIFEKEKRDGADEAGKKGERYVKDNIETILEKDDLLFNNVSVEYQGRTAEMDNIIVNNNGVFVVEVKYFSGTIYGSKDERKWLKRHVSEGKGIYVKEIGNPIFQVKRQEYILGNYLKDNGIRVWVFGYVYFVKDNAPIKDEYILESWEDLNYIIHMSERVLSDKEVEKISALLKKAKRSDHVTEYHKVVAKAA